MKFDEFSIGQMFETPSYKMNTEEIMTFASHFDPQYMHVDEEKAKQSRFKGIIASRLHTLSISLKLWNKLGVFGDDVIAGTGLNNLKFIKPVYPEDVLCVKATIIEMKKRKAEGEITLALSTFKNVDEQVLQTELSALISR
ncbi:acyl dehydratase [Cytobacillus eiseniae]|uniref:Acyl dehydratase n=1 Tax=Cytobacillus eiseniae TaxID=762947 RepID=A0ABS4RC06_9BACI|nr:MaoC/PaaZ C-terminal domain-containing protein [Cytobacillus eiseniae]MBP2240244.1 acyl dehydratase [Cytobacillus eiseniae]